MDSFGGTSAEKNSFPLNMGDETTLKQIFTLYHAPLRYFCEQLTGAEEECEDILSQLFLTLWNKKVKFDSKEHAQLYLYRSAKNACLNFIRNSKRAEEKKEALGLATTEISDNYLDVIIKTEVYAELYRAIEDLPSQCSKVITMAYIEGLSNQEIADEMGLSLHSIKTYKMRGLAVLRNKIPDNLFLLLLAYSVIR